MRIARMLPALCVCLALPLPLPAQEQEQEQLETVPVEAAAEPGPAKEDATALDEIVVTATKRAVSVREIPASVSALAGEDLERIGAQGVDDFVKLVPGVNINDDGGNGPKRVSVRGVTAELQTVFATGTLFGDVPFNDLFVPLVHLDPNPFDLATVEVLKGPHGTLFGGYGLNGMIRYVPEAPKLATKELKYYVQQLQFAQGGEEPNYGAALNLPVFGDTAAVRVMGFQRKAPGYTDDTQAGVPDVNTLDQSGYRGMLAWEPAQRWKVSLLHLGQDSYVADLASTDNLAGRLERDHTPRPSPTDTEYTLSSLGVGYSFDWAELAGQASHFTKDFANFLDLSRIANDGQDPVLGNAYFVSTDSWVFELRLLSPEDDASKWKWVAGVFGTPTDFNACVDSYAPPPPVPTASPPACPGSPYASEYNAGQFFADAQTTDVAAFGEVTRRLGERWDVTLGARYYRTQLTGTVITSGAVFEDDDPGPTVRHPELEEKGINPRVSAMYHATEDLLGYVSVARGFRFGGIQLAGDPLGNDLPDTYKSDTLWNYEIGTRADWLGRTLQTDVAAYYIEWKDPQLLQRTPDGLFTYTDNVGGAQGQGVELTVRYRVPFINGLMLDVRGAWNETVTTVPFTASSGTPVASGSPWPYAPEWQTTSAISYILPIGTWQGSAALRHNHVAEAWNVVERTARVFGYETLDFQLGVANLAWRWLPEMSVVANNLTDERGITGVVLLPNAEPSVTYLAPRSLMLRLAGSF